MCFAYKISKNLTTLNFVVQDVYGNTVYSRASLNTIADFNWHYSCIDLYAALKAADSTFTTAANKLTLLSVSILNNRTCLIHFSKKITKLLYKKKGECESIIL
jgi:hypothetical protein